MKLKDKEAWLELYEVAKNIQEQEPWKYLSDMDLFKYISDEYKDEFYYCVMGQAGIHTAIGVFDSKQINGVFELAQNDYPHFGAVNYQECLMVQFLDRNKTLPKNREIIKELGLKFRGTWISFENFEKGYEPSPLNIKQVKKMTVLLKNFYMMFKAYVENDFDIHFEDGEILVREYDKKTELYINYRSRIEEIKIERKIFGFGSDFENDVMKLPKKNLEFEYEFLNYYPMRIKENRESDGRYYYPRVKIFAIKNMGPVDPPVLVDKNKYKDEAEYIIECLDDLIGKIFEYGRPKTIYVRDKETATILSDLCKKAKIRLVVRSKLDVIDYIYDNMQRMM